MIERLAEYVAIPSITGEEAALAERFVQRLAEARLAVHRQGNNVWTEIGDAPRPRLLMTAHIDTVRPGGGWTSDPLALRRQGDRLVGLGANDDKGGVTVLLETFLAAHRELNRGGRLGGTFVMALAAEEEAAGQGLATILDELKPLDAAVVCEPTGLAPISAQRGLLILRGTGRGRTAHPGNTPPEAAQNAIIMAAEDVMRLRDFDWGETHPRLGRPHGNVTMIQAGIAHNVIPDSCEFCLDIRTTPLESHQALYQRLKTFLKSDLAIRSERLVPVETPDDSPIVRAACKAAGNRPPQGSPTMSDMVFMTGIPAVKMGPGESVRSHTADEFILESELVAGRAAYDEIIRSYFALAAQEGLK
jgi:acetylornithine deacetylase